LIVLSGEIVAESGDLQRAGARRGDAALEAGWQLSAGWEMRV
jgi:hypothetical protein